VLFAQEIVTRLHNRKEAETALIDFETRFKRGSLPEDIPEKILHITDDEIFLTQLLKQTGLTASTSESLRMIEQGAVKINGDKIEDKSLKLSRGALIVVQVGKRKFARVTIN
jgi:tyrosyl-tRNA synthetase